MHIRTSVLRRLGLAITAIAGTITMVLTATPAPAEAADYTGAGKRWAGSQIALHEGVHGAPPSGPYAPADQTLGHDVSGWQGVVDWPAAVEAGAKFVYVKATEGTGYRSPHFAQQYNGSYSAGLIRGAYHFARPDVSGGAAQADYFVRHGGGWSDDGKTLPGALDIEYNPYGDSCYDKTPAEMTAWVGGFTKRYHELTGRHPVIYTSTSWWTTCTGNSDKFGSTSPLWLARYAPEIGPLPAGWPTHSIWQWADAGSLPGDQNYFNGSMERLRTLALG